MDSPRSFAVLATAAILALAACGEDAPDTAPPTSAGDTAADTASGGTSSATTDAPATTEAPTTTVDLAGELDGRTFLSTAVEGYQLVDGTQVQLTFDAANIGATAGCNHLASTWSLEGDVLLVGPMAMTQMACTPAARMDQDTWLSSVLTSRPTIALDGATLTLTAEGAVVILTDRAVADPDRPLEGTAWTVDGLITGDAVSSVPTTSRAPTLVLDGGTVTVDTGCNRGTGSYELGDGDITFGPLATTRAACTDPAAAEAERVVLATLTGTSIYEIEAGQLTLQTGTDGLMLRAAADAEPAAMLEGPTWMLESLVTADATVSQSAGSTLTFDSGTVSAQLACNTGTGSYTVAGDQITFGPMATTLAACAGPGSTLESGILAVLTGTVTFAIDGDVLTLTNGANGLTYVAG